MQVFGLLLACLAVIGFAGHRLFAHLVAREIATRISTQVQQQHDIVRQKAGDSDVIRVLLRGRVPEQLRVEEEILGGIPNAVSARLVLSSGQTVRDDIGAEDLAFVAQLVISKTVAVSGFHESGLPSEHYDVAHPVMLEKKLLGYILASFPTAPLMNRPDGTSASGYFELHQSHADGSDGTMVSFGDSGHHGLLAPEVHTIDNAGWELMYWPTGTQVNLLAGNPLLYLIAIALTAITAIGVTLILHSNTRRYVRHDIKSLLRMFHDVRDGNVRVAYPMLLKEFSSAHVYMRDSGKMLLEEKQKFKDMGLIDHLSQLSNRRHFETRLKELFELGKTHGPSSVLIIDVDHFKQVNDTHGHDAGDALIVNFAKALRKSVRQNDFLARLGGDEFCVVYPFTPLNKAILFTDRLRHHIPRDVPLTKGVMHNLRWTGGLSTTTDADKKFDDVLWRADQAMIKAKEAGRNKTSIFDSKTGLQKKSPVV